MPDLPCRGGGGGGLNPTSMAQNDTHVALIILTTQMWEGNYWWKKLFRAKILCSCAFGANIRSYTKQRGRHGTPFLQPPPPPSFGGRPCHPPPPPPPPPKELWAIARVHKSQHKAQKEIWLVSGLDTKMPAAVH